VVKKKVDAGEEKPNRTTIFHQLLDPNASEGHVVPSIEHLNDEAFTILGAASETTGNAMSVTMYHVISNPAIYATLSTELNKAFPSPNAKLDFVTLEQLPYLVCFRFYLVNRLSILIWTDCCRKGRSAVSLFLEKIYCLTMRMLSKNGQDSHTASSGGFQESFPIPGLNSMACIFQQEYVLFFFLPDHAPC
jgi:Cytochrome P450